MKKIISALLVNSLILGTCYAGIPIYRMANPGSTNFTAQKSKIDVVSLAQTALDHAHINIGVNSPYASTQVQLLRSSSGEYYLLIHLKSRYYFSYRIIRVNLNANNTIKYPIIPNYHLTKSDFLAQTNALNHLLNTKPSCPAEYMDGRPLFVLGVPPYNADIKDSTYQAVKEVTPAVKAHSQYQLVSFLGKDATIANYQNILMCPNLKYFFHIGGEDDWGESFILSDGDFDASYFANNPNLNLNDKIISFDTCRAFDQVPRGFCPIITSMKHTPLAYTTGSSQLLMFGSPETYACFWKQVLNGAPVSKSTLTSCAEDYDPSVSRSKSGVYLIGDMSYQHMNPANTGELLIKTNQRNIKILKDTYGVLKLKSNEVVQSYQLKTPNNGTHTCTADPHNTIQLLNNPNLKAAEFILRNDSDKSCQFTEISRMRRAGGITRDIYGFYPDEKTCFHQPVVARLGLTLMSEAGTVDVSCNGINLFNPIGNYLFNEDWKTIQADFNSNDLQCVFSLSSNKLPILLANFNIKPSSTLPGRLSAKISDIKNLNGYLKPDLLYSGKGDVEGYHNGISVTLNPA